MLEFNLIRVNETVFLDFGRGTPFQFAEGVTAFDVTGDGLAEFFFGPTFFSEFPELPLAIFRNEGGGIFVEAASEIIDNVPTTGVINHATIVADFNGDGILDVF